MLTLLTVAQSDEFKNNFKVYEVLEQALRELLKSCYYLSLVIVKATKYQCININANYVNEFSKRAQRLNFETGIPLMKTMKINNDECFGFLKMM